MGQHTIAPELHDNGVHTHCEPPKGKGRFVANGQTNPGDGTHRACHLHGTVERFHSHDHDGPLVCGCDEDYLC